MLDQKAGRLFLVTAPSGAGKSSLVAALLKADPTVHLSISHTTRAPRPGEENGREYHFVSVDDFEKLKEDNAFLEWAYVHGNYYGTSKKWIAEELEKGHDVLLEIDWQGALQVKRLFPDVVGIFILPPSGGKTLRGCLSYSLISISTPAGSSRLIRASTVLGVELVMSMRRL